MNDKENEMKTETNEIAFAKAIGKPVFYEDDKK